MNYLELCGLLAGSMTAPAALSFAARRPTPKRRPRSQATVFPLVIIRRVVSVQILAVTTR